VLNKMPLTWWTKKKIALSETAVMGKCHCKKKIPKPTRKLSSPFKPKSPVLGHFGTVSRDFTKYCFSVHAREKQLQTPQAVTEKSLKLQALTKREQEWL